ncbi:hypothetical protein PT285_04245 [Lactobacillus sp. ESL0791]|uniref:alpha-L-rhamnosidase-related protein n=1 Tax=Lactobacillus sp. ESL0791 TaxID=2983234 RepID=UPI0023F9F696|nr:hypothetical protein [Lactobacillus sp. ESL0791]MDF7638609.1 hypothetical protein [Lactobacillus sp. ESL0791]
MAFQFNNSGQQSAFEDNSKIPTVKQFQPQFLQKAIANQVRLNYQTIAVTQAINERGKKIPLAQLPVLTKGTTLVLDLGQYYVGHFRLQFTTAGSYPDAPALVNLRYCETQAELTCSAAYQGWLPEGWIQEETVKITDFPATFTAKDRTACRYLKLTVIATSEKYGLRLKKCDFRAQTAADFKLPEEKADKDLQLMRIDQLAQITLQNCMQGVFEDGPKRDRRLWLGDFRIQSLCASDLQTDFAIIKHCLYLFAGTQTSAGNIAADIFAYPRLVPDDLFMLDYNLLFVDTLANYYRATADRATLNELYPVAEKTIMFVADRAPSGEIPAWLVQTAFLDWLPDGIKIDRQAALQGVYLYALKQLRSLASTLEVDTVNITALIKQQEDLIKSKYYDASKRLFVSGPDKQASWWSQIWLTRADALGKDVSKQVLDTAIRTLKLDVFMTPYAYGELCLSLCEHGLKENALKLIRDYWGKMLADGAETSWEVFNPQKPNYSPYGVNSQLVLSHCHGWGSWPTYLLRHFLRD